MKIHCHLLPELMTEEELPESTAVVIDVLRASTTICHTLAAGADAVIPCLTTDEARSLRERRPELLLGGERGGVKIDGFDLGNSPFEYTPEIVTGKTIAFTTTNGTKALHRCREARLTVIGGFVNLSAVVACLLDADRPVHLVCAGTNGAITAEDVLFAGAVAAELQVKRPNVELVGDGVRLALDFYRTNSQNEAQFLAAMLDSQGGRNLQQLGQTSDIERAAERNRFSLAPQWNSASNTISSE